MFTSPFTAAVALDRTQVHIIVQKTDMDLSAVQRYCGGKWTGEHRRTDQMLRVMSHILPDDLFQELAAGLVDGVPNLLNTTIPSEEVASLLTTNNLPTVAKNPELVDKAILKEERNHLSLVFSKHLAYFTPNLGIIKLGILDKKHKKPRMYRHGSYVSEASTNPINNLVDCNSANQQSDTLRSSRSTQHTSGVSQQPIQVVRSIRTMTTSAGRSHNVLIIQMSPGATPACTVIN